MQLTVDKLISVLPKLKRAGITHQLRGADFAPTNFKLDDSLTLKASIVTEGVDAQAQLRKAKNKSMPADVRKLLENGGLMSVDVDHSSEKPLINYQTHKLDTKTALLEERRYQLENGTFK